ncbi:PaaI family thioesterase [bacterium]|nr:PaaI family thioesterase [bacterium]
MARSFPLDSAGFNPFGELIGLSFTGVEDGCSRSLLQVEPKLKNPNGVVHGGALYAMADTGMGAALLTLLEDDEVCTTVEIKIQYFKSATSGSLTCESRVVHRASRLAFLESEIRNGDRVVVETVLYEDLEDVRRACRSLGIQPGGQRGVWLCSLAMSRVASYTSRSTWTSWDWIYAGLCRQVRALASNLQAGKALEDPKQEQSKSPGRWRSGALLGMNFRSPPVNLVADVGQVDNASLSLGPVFRYLYPEPIGLKVCLCFCQAPAWPPGQPSTTGAITPSSGITRDQATRSNSTTRSSPGRPSLFPSNGCPNGSRSSWPEATNL